MDQNLITNFTKLIKRLVFPKLNEILSKELYCQLVDVEVKGLNPLPNLKKIAVNVYLEDGDMSVGSEEMDDVYIYISHSILNVSDYVDFKSNYQLIINYYDINNIGGSAVTRHGLTSYGVRYSDSKIIDELIEIIKGYEE